MFSALSKTNEVAGNRDKYLENVFRKRLIKLL